MDVKQRPKGVTFVPSELVMKNECAQNKTSQNENPEP